MQGRKITKVHYQQNSLLLLTLAFIWIISALSGAAKHPNLSIIIFLVGIALIQPIHELICHSAGVKKPAQESCPDLLMKCLTIALPLGLMTIFFPFAESINLFYPSFAVLLAVVFGITAYNNSSLLYWNISAALIISAAYPVIWHFESFMMGALIPGMMLAFYGFLAAITGEIKSRIFTAPSKAAKMQQAGSGAK